MIPLSAAWSSGRTLDWLMFLLKIFSYSLFGVRLWARHVHDRFRDAVAVTTPCHAPMYSDPDHEAIRDFNQGSFQALTAARACSNEHSF
jgi:hypothetical protein